MTASLIVHRDHDVAILDAPTQQSREWSSLYWKPHDELPDVSGFMRNWGDIVEFEVGVGDVSIVPGQPAKPALPLQVSIEPGPGYAIVWELERNIPTYFPIGREFVRRGVLVPVDRRDLILQAKRVARGVFSRRWFSEGHPRFGPCEMPQPALGGAQSVAIQALDSSRLQGLRTALANGMVFHVDDTEDGPVMIVNGGWRPWGPANPGAPAGSGIYFMTGWRQNTFDLQLAVLASQCEHERMLRYYHRATGAPLTVDDYPGAGPSPDLWGGPLPETVGVPNSDPNPPPFDFAHEIRGKRRTIQLTEQTDYPMARRSLAGVAAVSRMRFSERGRLPVPGYVPLNLATLNYFADLTPGVGVWGAGPGRNIGWSFFGNAQNMKVNGASPGQLRFAAAACRFVDKAGMPSGGLQKAWGAPFPEQRDPVSGAMIYTTQTFETVILAHGTYAIARQAGLPVPQQVMRLLAGIYGKDTKVPLLPYYGGRGPCKFLVTATKDGVVPEFENGFGVNAQVQGDATHAEAACALAHHITKDPAWLTRGALYNTEYATWQQKRDALTAPGATMIDWQAGLLGQYQSA